IAVRVGAEHAVVEVVVGIGPERVIRIRIEGVVDEVVVGVRPEQRADKSDHDRKRAMPPPLRVEEAALERRVRQRARAGIAGGGHAGKTLVAQTAAGEGGGVTGRGGAGRRLRNDAVHLILRNHGLRSPALLWSRARRLILLNRMLLRSHVLLWSGAARLVLLNDPLLRSNVLLWRDVAAAVPGGGRSCCGSAARASLRCQILPLAGLGNSCARAAADIAAAHLRLLGGSRRAPRRRRVPRHGRSCAAGRTREMLRRRTRRLRRARR